MTFSNHRAKERHELAVFAEFAAVALQGEKHDGIVSCQPPEPDVLFRSQRNCRYFELGRLLDAEYSRTVLQALRQAPAPITPDLTKIKLPEREILLAKLLKSYESHGLPVELILYFDAEHLHLQGARPPIEFSVHAEYVMAPLLRDSMGAFSRVWVFDRYQHSVLWEIGSGHGSA